MLVKNSFKDIKNDFLEEFFLCPNIGVELEFYLLDGDSGLCDDDVMDNFISQIKRESLIYDIEKERGQGQVEVKFFPTIDFDLLCCEIESVKKNIYKLAEVFNVRACFDAQPFIDDCPNALQINLSFLDENSANLFSLASDDSRKILGNSVAGILQNLEKNIGFYVAGEGDFARFDLATNVALHGAGKFCAPVNLTFGYDNRTCAIRVLRGKNARLEFRVPCANCDPCAAILAFLKSVLDGLRRDLQADKSCEIYGNAFDEQYFGRAKMIADFFKKKSV